MCRYTGCNSVQILIITFPCSVSSMLSSFAGEFEFGQCRVLVEGVGWDSPFIGGYASGTQSTKGRYGRERERGSLSVVTEKEGHPFPSFSDHQCYRIQRFGV